MIVILLILGMFLESLSMMLVTVPILLPVIKALGIEPLAFGVFMVLAVEAALITPPVGMNLFTICTIGKIDFAKISQGNSALCRHARGDDVSHPLRAAARHLAAANR